MGEQEISVSRITTDAELTTVLPALLAADMLGIDVETTGLDSRRDRIMLLQISTADRVHLIDPRIVDLAPIAALFGEAGPQLVGHNLAFDLGFLHAAGLPMPPGFRLFDTMLASQLLDGGQNLSKKAPDPAGTVRGGRVVSLGFHTLAMLAHRMLGEVLDKSHQTSDWSAPLSQAQLAYAAKDAAVLLPLRNALDAALVADGLADVMALEFNTLPAAVWLEQSGTPIDTTAWIALRDAAADELTALDQALAEALPGINVDSHVQLVRALAELGVAVANVQEATLRTVVDQHPVVDLVLRRKDQKKRVSTYGDTYLTHVHQDTGRIHAGYRLIGAASGRMACRTPNLQNIPREDAYRRCVRPAAGRVLIKADYSQIELRIAAQVSGDVAMLTAFRDGEDLHTRTARAVMGREPSRQDRQLAKALNFGLLYGMGATRLRFYAQNNYGVELSEQEAIEFRQRFFAAYPGIRAWHQSQRDGVIETRTLLGRVRRDVSSFAEKLASPISGTGADILKWALVLLWEHRAEAPSAVPVLTVHDELVFEVDATEAEAAVAWITRHMIAAGQELLSEVPVEVEAAIVQDWSGTPWN